MSWSRDIRTKIRGLDAVIRDLDDGFVGRTEAIRLLVLAALCREHLLLIGPPGTAKTLLITRFTEMVDAKGFHYLLSRFSEPAELFGPPDMKAFKEGRWHTNTNGMLPEAEIAFLDEVFQGSSAILNALLSLAAERIYHNGSQRVRCPLWTIVGAANHLPDDPGLEAFADRFTLRLMVEPVADDQIGPLLDQGWHMERQRACAAQDEKVLAHLEREELQELQRRVMEVKVKPILGAYARLVRDLRTEGVSLSDRRAVRGLKLVAGAALLRGSDQAEPQDLWPVRHLWQRPEHATTTAAAVDAMMAEDGGGGATPDRPVEEILEELGVLTATEQRLAGEVALGAHLIPLNQLRNELLRNHGEAAEAIAAVEGAIERVLKRLEAAYV